MTYAEIIAKFKEHTSGLADDLSNTEVVAYLNRFYQFNLPAEIDGQFSEIIWEERNVSAPTLGLVVPSYVTAIRGKCWVLGTETHNVDVVRDFQLFINDWPNYQDFLDVNARGRPTEVCLYGDQVFFNRSTDVDYTFRFEARGGPKFAIRSTDTFDDPHGLAILTGAAWDFLNEKEDEQGAAREFAQYEQYKSMLRARSKHHFKTRRLVRSF